MPANNQRIKFQRGIALLFFTSLCIWLINSSINNHIAENNERWIHLAKSVVASMPADEILKLNEANNLTQEQSYKTIENSLVEVVDINKGARTAYIYTMKNGKAFILADSKAGTPRINTEPREAALVGIQTFKNGAAQIYGYHSSGWSSWKSVLVPIVDKSTGKTVAVFGLEFDSTTWRSFQLRELIVTFLLILISLMLAYILFKRKSKKNDQDFGTSQNNAVENKIQLIALALKGVNLLVCVTDLENKFLFVNQVFLDKYGYKESELIGKSVFTVFSSKNSEEILGELINSSQADGWEGELLTTGRNGQEFTIHLSTAPLYEEHSKRIATIYVANDITQMISDQALLAQSEERFRLAAKATKDAVWERDLITNKQWHSDNFQTIFGWIDEPLEYTDSDTVSKVHPDDRQRSFEKVHQFFTSDDDYWEDEYRYQRKDGTYAWVLDRAYKLRDKKGKPIRVIGAMQDLTERKEAELELFKAKEKAEESDQLKTAFLQNISHEIRTPLNAIIGFSRFLSDSDLTPEKRNYFAKIIEQSGTQLHSIVSDIISISTIQTGQEIISEREIDLSVMLSRLYEQFLPKAQEQLVTLTLGPILPESNISIITDESKLIQTLSKLINNALKFTPQGGIDFGFRVKDAFLEFYVKDTGVGIPKELYEEVFKNFQKNDTSSSHLYRGTGLGLSIAKAYVKMLGGEIWFTSELGVGSTFYFTIPYKKGEANTLTEIIAVSPSKMNVKNPKQTILIAEDEASNTLLLKVMLAKLNLTIVDAKNGMEAVEICQSNKHVDLVLMDIKMPVMNGIEATKHIRALLPDLPIIAQTAYASAQDRIEIMASGCSDFISKPINQELLISMVNKHLKKP